MNLVEVNQIWIVFNLYQLFWSQNEFSLFPNKPEKGKYNMIQVDLTRIKCQFIFQESKYVFYDAEIMSDFIPV